MNTPVPATPPNKPEPASPDAPPTYNSRELFLGHFQINILHKDMRYTLRETREGKLILTK